VIWAWGSPCFTDYAFEFETKIKKVSKSHPNSKIPFSQRKISFLLELYHSQSTEADLNILSQFIPLEILPSLVENQINKGLPTT